MSALILTTIELSLIGSLTVLGLYLSYTVLNICDLSTDGCFTLGACVGAMVALSGHPHLAIIAAMIAGIFSGLTVSILQCYFGINSLLSGIIVNTALYSVNIAVMGNSSLVNLNKTVTVYSIAKGLLSDTPFSAFSSLLIEIFFVLALIGFLLFFLKTRIGLAVKATGDNRVMVEASSIDPRIITLIGLSIANSFTALSGCLLALSQRSCNIDIGSGMVTIALASLLIGRIFSKERKLTVSLFCAVLGTFIFRSIYALALRLNMPAFMLKLVSAFIVALAISIPYLRSKLPLIKRRRMLKKEAA
ncbi:MAG: ABC transporter permease [Erysipelotrichaceae bacterium]|nr:ABC transporter permease [Erysipelotrichaceae bacterium]